MGRVLVIDDDPSLRGALDRILAQEGHERLWCATGAEGILRAAGVDPGARGESLTVADFARIAAVRARPSERHCR